MLLKDFSKPVIVANLLAWPLAFIAVRSYLNIFIHRIALSPVPFALSLAITLRHRLGGGRRAGGSCRARPAGKRAQI